MKVGILGTGDVGRALGNAFITLGHEVVMGARDPNNEKAKAWVQEARAIRPDARASAGTFATAAKAGELVVLATLGSANGSAIAAAGPESFRGKLVLDTTNPLDFSGGFPPKLLTGPDGSAGKQVQRLLPGAQVVKCFNTVGNAHMFRPSFPGGPPDMFICGDSVEAKRRVGTLLADFGWGTVDVGGIDCAHYLEAMCAVWVLYGSATGSWNHAFKLLRK